MSLSTKSLPEVGQYAMFRRLGEVAFDETGRLVRTVGTLQDISAHKQADETRPIHATHDALTGLLNRDEFERRVQRVLDTARTLSGEHALCYLDLDRFRVVNDACGQIAGDELLRQLGELTWSTRTGQIS